MRASPWAFGGTFDTFLALNTNPSFALGGGIYATTYF